MCVGCRLAGKSYTQDGVNYCHCGAEVDIYGMCAPCKYAAHESCECSKPRPIDTGEK